MKVKNYMISTDIEKIDKIQYPLVINDLNKVGIGGMYFTIKKGYM